MNPRQPSFRRSKDGRFLTKWGGRNRYFGRDHEAAWVAYIAELGRWRAWRDARDAAIRAPSPGRRLLVIDLAEQFIDLKTTEAGHEAGAYYRKHLKRFLHACGSHDAASIRPNVVQAYKLDLIEAGDLAAKTVNHDLTAIKGMLQWGANMELIPPVNLAAIRKLPLGPVTSRAVSADLVRLVVYAAPGGIREWLAVNYLAACRPSELPRLVARQGEWCEEGVFRLNKGKMDKRSRLHRHIVLSDLAIAWLERCEPRWHRLDSYSQAVRDACGNGGPHRLRHSAATHLLAAGVARVDVDVILGHLPSRVSLTYADIPWQRLRLSAGRLTL